MPVAVGDAPGTATMTGERCPSPGEMPRARSPRPEAFPPHPGIDRTPHPAAPGCIPALTTPNKGDLVPPSPSRPWPAGLTARRAGTAEAGKVSESFLGHVKTLE
ncbi:classical arabinogalactan protein 3-like [Strigops habroptila]|uniref:classical arabinogalactan protein 3-like n=1 Tax=Strigops habroptila TaxID=2489341 RepID=UPI0011CFC338|nr:classical arabinogalactan protein 3-like [Strigops habroptila]